MVTLHVLLFQQVQPEMALCAAKAASLQGSGAWQTCLGAVQLTCLAGFEGVYTVWPADFEADRICERIICEMIFRLISNSCFLPFSDLVFPRQ